MSDRHVHGLMADGTEIVRYDRAGTWYAEPANRTRERLTVGQAAYRATLGQAFLGKAGGLRFDAEVRRLRVPTPSG
jgi:hypothetical protein